jgi:hypothetical protein
VTARLRAGDVVAFLGPSLTPEAARRIAPCRVLPPARAGDVLALLPERPLAIALVDGLFDTTPSVWPRELLAALDAGVMVFGAASMGALRAAELASFGVVGVGRVFGWYRDGVVTGDDEVALLHATAEQGYRPLTLPLVQVRAAAEAARSARLIGPARARALVEAAGAIPYADRAWPGVIDAARLPAALRARVEAFVREVPDVKAADACACVEAAAAFARARRAGAPAPPRPDLPPPPAHLRRARLRFARSVLPDGRAVAGADVLAALARRPDAGRLGAEGLRRALVASLGRSLGLRVSAEEAEAAVRAWLARLDVPAAKRPAFLAASGLDDGAARRIGEDLALEAAVLAAAERVVPDGPSWEEGLALAARLVGVWVAEAAGAGAISTSTSTSKEARRRERTFTPPPDSASRRRGSRDR